MKKLMFAIAAVAAGTVLADVTSANVVGYSNKNLNENGQLLTAQFLNVGSAKSFWVSDLKVIGYENNSLLRDEDHYGTWGGDFYFYTLNEYGVAQDMNTYGWCDEFDGENWGGGYWTGPDGDVAPGENDIDIAPGQCYWFYVSIIPEDTDHFTFELPSPIAKHTAD